MIASATALLADLERRGVQVSAAGDRLRLRPADRVPADLIPTLRERKAEIIAALEGAGPGPLERLVALLRSRGPMLRRDVQNAFGWDAVTAYRELAAGIDAQRIATDPATCSYLALTVPDTRKRPGEP